MDAKQLGEFVKQTFGSRLGRLHTWNGRFIPGSLRVGNPMTALNAYDHRRALLSKGKALADIKAIIPKNINIA